MTITIEQAIRIEASNPSKPPASDVITAVAKKYGVTSLDILERIGGYANYPKITGQNNLPDRFGKLNTSM